MKYSLHSPPQIHHDLEFHFPVGAENLFINANLSKDKWHGKNIVVSAKSIHIKDSVKWDISGLANNHIYPKNAGTNQQGNGIQGRDGFAGESGGNISIYGEEIINASNWTIISNGGNGSPSEAGGNGMDGKDGTGITVEELKKKCPKFDVYDSKDHISKYCNDIQTCYKIKTELFQRDSEYFETKIPIRI